MEEKGFNYIENLAVVQLDQSKIATASSNKKGIKQQQQSQAVKSEKSKITGFFPKNNSPYTTASSEDKTESQESAEESKVDIFETIRNNPDLQANDIFYEGEAEYFKKSKKVLLMFRRVFYFF